MTSILVIPDAQVKPGVSLDYLKWIGRCIVTRQPEIIICIGDFADMHSLSSYDKGKLQFEGRRYREDIDIAKKGMNLMLEDMRQYNKKKINWREAQYKPRMVLTLGNHEARIQKIAENSPELDGMMSYDDLPYEDWEVIDFLKPINICGVNFVHYLSNPFTGKPLGGNALNQLSKVGTSFICGHKQTLEIATRFTLDKKQQWGIVCGAAYDFDEPYKGYQGNPHYRGCIWLDNVSEGNFDPSFISLNFLKKQYLEK